ncbi:MAG: ORF6N domain-containing protein [Treponema sp.]|uniref:ORF6N domain-containing protein n=1 Tax=Treponema sp. TaxID=166 RepID=UPI00298DF99B|nr:ORF6N domain-containing protein [Treponema sp.]MCQ2601388.1 ORF6N domain-containing protein [Treponema sp.]
MENVTAQTIEDKIFTIRGVQVMLDKDLAELYGVETRILNQSWKRNIERFPEEFCFQLTKDEVEILRSQIVTLNDENDNLKSHFATSKDENASLRSQNATLNNENEPSRSQIVILNNKNELSRSQIATLNSGRGSNIKYLPYAFTEQGVAMLASILKSETAVKVSIQIMNAFVQMRHFLSANGSLFARLDSVEKRQIETEEKLNRNLVQIHEKLDVHEKNFEKVFDALEAADLPKQGVFCDGQIFDSYKFASDLIRKAKTSIVLVDNYVDDTVLSMLDKRKPGVSATIYTQSISKQLSLDLQKHNAQYSPIDVRVLKNFHDRFLFLDEKTIYHIGASLKDLGKKVFGFSKLGLDAKQIMNMLGVSV